MPTYSVQLLVNVPTVGEARPVFVGIVAATIEEAIKQAAAGVIIRALAAQQTAE